MAQRFVIELVGGEEIEADDFSPRKNAPPVHRVGVRFGDAHESVVWLEQGLHREVQVYSSARRTVIYPQASNTFYVETET